MADNPSESTNDTGLNDERAEEVDELLRGLYSGQVLYAGVKLGMFEVIGIEPISAKTVAEELGLDPAYSYRLLRALAHFEVLEAHDDRRFSLTPIGALFDEDHPHSRVNRVLLGRSPEFLSSLIHLPDVVREGGPSGFVREFGCNSFEYAEEHPEFAEAFNRAMTNQSQQTTPDVLDALDDYDFGQFAHICDVGGGHGHTLCHLLVEHPHLNGTILDLPNVIETEEAHWAPKLEISDRCEYVAGDMFESVPRADAYLLKFILHDWPDDDCVEILSTIHDAAPRDARLFVVEGLLPDLETSDPRIIADIGMMVYHDGRERTEAEYRSLLEQADWEFIQTWTPDGGENTVSVVEAKTA